MKKKVLLIILVGFLGVVVSFKYFENLEFDKYIQKKTLIQAMYEIERIWRQGSTDDNWQKGLLKCQALPTYRKNISSSFLLCNPLLFQCIHELGVDSSRNPFVINGKKVGFREINDKKIYRTHYKTMKDSEISRDYAFEFEIFLEGERENLRFVLFDSCRDTYLPEGIYANGVLNKKKDWKWDNFKQDIFIDKFPVSNWQVNEWIKAFNKKIKRSVFYSSTNSYQYSTNLTEKEKKEFCEDHGRTVLNSRVFDAATFFRKPDEVMKSDFLYIPREPYPWGFKKEESPLYQATTDDQFEFSTNYCSMIYSKECLGKKDMNFFSTDYPSWVGIYELLGGFPEFVENKLDEQQSLIPSSFSQKFSSKLNQLGIRKRMDYLASNSKIQFRCMKIVGSK